MQEAAIGPALKLNFDLRKDVRGKFLAKERDVAVAGKHQSSE